MNRVTSRLLLVAVLLLASCTAARAQRIFLLSVGDTSEKGGLAFSTGPDLQYMFDAFYANVPRGQLVMYNFPSDTPDGRMETLWQGPDVRHDLVDMKNKILTAIDQCPSGANDTIIVFYTGHGASDDEGHFLVMPDGETRLHRKTILERVARKGPRLAVLITDACNLSVGSGIGGQAAAHIAQPQTISPLFASLFINSRGVVDINSSSEGEVSIGAIGGGLLTLSLAYMGNQPNFKAYPGFTRPQPDAEEQPSGAVIPSIDHTAAMAKFFGGLSEHGMHGNFDPSKPAFGVFFEYSQQNLGWDAVSNLLKTKIQILFKAAAPEGWDNRGEGGKQTTQTPRFYSLAPTAGGLSQPMPIQPSSPTEVGQPTDVGQPTGSTQPQVRWSPPTYRPSVGDMILEVNGRPIRNINEYYYAVKNSPAIMTFVLWEARTGRKYLLRAQLNPPGSNSRLGIGGQDAPGGGVRVVYVMQGYPGARCQVAQ